MSCIFHIVKLLQKRIFFPNFQKSLKYKNICYLFFFCWKGYLEARVKDFFFKFISFWSSSKGVACYIFRGKESFSLKRDDLTHASLRFKLHFYSKIKFRKI